MLEKIHEALWIAEGKMVSFYGFPYPTRPMVARLESGDPWVGHRFRPCTPNWIARVAFAIASAQMSCISSVCRTGEKPILRPKCGNRNRPSESGATSRGVSLLAVSRPLSGGPTLIKPGSGGG
jgi:hypothetical protein